MKTYVEKIRLGPSGPSRQANALGVLAGVLPAGDWPTVRRRIFDNPRISPVITAYFGYYEQMARGLCGDPVAPAWSRVRLDPALSIPLDLARRDPDALWASRGGTQYA